MVTTGMLNVLILDGFDANVKAVARAIRLSRQKSISLWFMSALIMEDPYKSWRDQRIIDIQAKHAGVLPNLYFEWDIYNQSVQVLGYELRCLWALIKNLQMEFCILTSSQNPRGKKVLFEDSLTDPLFPGSFEHVRCFTDYDSLMNYCKERGEVKFSLKDSLFFKHEKDIPPYKGEEVYREIATERLWYLDSMHKDHYEVFDSRGKKHLAEANLNGIVDFSKADSSKHPIVR